MRPRAAADDLADVLPNVDRSVVIFLDRWEPANAEPRALKHI